jgi:hypothetical protein
VSNQLLSRLNTLKVADGQRYRGSLATWSGLWKYIDKSLGNLQDSLSVSTATSLLLYTLGLERPHPYLVMNTYYYIAVEKRKTELKMAQVILRHYGDPNGLYEVDHTI